MSLSSRQSEPLVRFDQVPSDIVTSGRKGQTEMVVGLAIVVFSEAEPLRYRAIRGSMLMDTGVAVAAEEIQYHLLLPFP